MSEAIDTMPARRSDRVESAAVLALYGVAGALQFSIAIAQILLVVSLVCWVVMLATGRTRLAVPRFFWPLLVYAGLTLVSTAVSPEPRVSLMADKQMVLFLLVPLVYTLVTGPRASALTMVILTCAAASAVIGIIQYGIFDYDNLHRRIQGTLGHYMTYSGLLMLVIGVALARVLFGKGERTWPALVIPALAVAVVISFTRTAAVGACAAAAVLLTLKDFRLLAALPVIAAIFLAIAPAPLTARFASTFDLTDPTNRDRLAMLREGEHMIRTHPLFGIGPNMVRVEYAEYRDPQAVNAINPHLHNVPMQIAAERGLPALAAWLCFVAVVLIDLAVLFRAGPYRFLAAAALSAMIATLAAGLFEYNFGDSEFLMLLLVLITLPFAAARNPGPDPAAA